MFDLKSRFPKLELVVIITIEGDLPDRVNEAVIRKGDVVVSNLSDDGSLEYLREGPLDESLGESTLKLSRLISIKTHVASRATLGRKSLSPLTLKASECHHLGMALFRGWCGGFRHVPSLLIQGVTDNCKADDSLGYPAATVAACARQITTELFASKQLLPTLVPIVTCVL